jgi:hypothetical protein
MMAPGLSWLLLLVVLGAVVLGAFVVGRQLERDESEANEPLEEAGWREMDPEPTTVRVIRPPYDRTKEANPI